MCFSKSRSSIPRNATRRKNSGKSSGRSLLMRLEMLAATTKSYGSPSVDWFERLTGFREGKYEYTRSRLEVERGELRSKINGARYKTGVLELAPLQSLRERVAAADGSSGRLKLRNISGDVRQLHQAPEFAGALFQVASQFNLLEMVSPRVTPEDGVTRYESDGTQGPACAIAAGAGTIYRNYFVPFDGRHGQTKDRQLDGLADLGAMLGKLLNKPMHSLWTMQNGYALCSAEGLELIGAHLRAIDANELEQLRSLLRIGLHWDVEVTEMDRQTRPMVSQAFCSALPVAYTNVHAGLWQPFAELILEAAYEATLWAAVLNARRGASNIVLLTRLGGGAFGNEDRWIDAAMRRALEKAVDFDLDVRVVSYGPVSTAKLALETTFG